MRSKKIMFLVPSAYNMRALGDVINFVDFYKNDFDVFIPVKGIESETIKKKDYTLVDIETSYGKYLRATADYVIDAGSMNNSQKRGENCKWFSVWHGIPYKKMFIDKQTPELDSAILYGNAYEAMFSSSKYYTDTFLHNSMLYEGPVHETGCSRMDSLFNKSKSDIEGIKKILQIPLDKKVILYAPTFRKEGAVELPFDSSKLNEIISDEYVLAVKLHYLNELTEKNDAIIDVTNYENISDILLCTDILISDYSSLMFDFSILKKPIILYQYDSEKYFKDRGVYFDLANFFSSESIVNNEKDLFELFKIKTITKLKNNLVENFYPYEDGKSTQRIVEKIAADPTIREHKDLIFLVNDKNEIGGVHTFINNMSKYYKEQYNARIFVIAVNEFSNKNSEVKFFNCEYIDFVLSYRCHPGAVNLILKNSDANVIALQFSAFQFFQDKIKNGNVSLMFHGDSQSLIDATDFRNHLKRLNNHQIYNYKNLVLLSKPDIEKLRPYLNTEIAERLTYFNNSVSDPFVELGAVTTNAWAFIGRLDDQKNPLALIDLGKEIIKNNSNMIINIYGDGLMKKELENAIAKNKLEHVLILRGYESDKKVIFSENRGLVMVSKYEGYPYVILEAYSYGRPVVLYDTFTAAKDLVEDGKAGYLVANLDSEKLFKAMKKAESIEITNIKEIYEKHSPEHIFKLWEQLFKKNELLKPVEKAIKLKRPFSKRIKGRMLRILKSILKGYFAKRDYQKELLNYQNKIATYSNVGVSIIIPAYNTTKTIGATIDSVVAQKLKDYEIIIVDDGSKDVDELKKIVKSKNNNSIHLYDKKINEGLSLTRNYGIKKATKEYIFFLDSDDTIPSLALSKMLIFMLEKDLNVVSGICNRIYLEKQKSEYWRPELYKKKHVYRNTYTRMDMYEDTLSTNKMYRKKALKEHGILFEKGLYEDKIFSSLVYSKVPSIGVIDEVVYNWFIYGNNTSITTSKSLDNFMGRLQAVIKTWENCNENAKYTVFNLFIKHDMLIYIREFNAYTYEDKITIFNQAKEFIKGKEKYYNEELVRNNTVRRYYKTILENNIDEFIKLGDLVSAEYHAKQ